MYFSIARRQIWLPVNDPKQHSRFAKGLPEHPRVVRAEQVRLWRLLPTLMASAVAPTTTFSTGSEKPSCKTEEFSPFEAASLFAHTRIQSLLICALYRFHNGDHIHGKRTVATPLNPRDPYDPLCTSMTIPFTKRIIKLPAKLTNKTTSSASAVQALGLKLDKTHVFWNGKLFQNRVDAHDAPELDSILNRSDAGRYGPRFNLLFRSRYTVDLWEDLLLDWVKKEDPFRVDSESGPPDYWPGLTPASEWIMSEALAWCIFEHLRFCSRFQWEIVTSLRYDRSSKLSPLVRLPMDVKLFLGMSMAEDDKEMVLWNGEAMELERAREKDFKMWKQQPEWKRERWNSGAWKSYSLKESREKNLPVIRRCPSKATPRK